MTIVEQTPSPSEDKKPLQVVERVTKYETVTNLVTSVLTMYTQAKDSNNLVKMGCETLEKGVNQGYQWVAPKVEPITQTNIYKKYSEPLITTVDQLGCKSLDALEQLNHSYQTTVKPNVEKQLEIVKTAGVVGVASQLAEKSKELAKKSQEYAIQSVEPVDNYLKDSLLGSPISKILDTTESICDRVFPETQVDVKEGKTETETPESSAVVNVAVKTEGPIFRSGKLSKRVQRGLAQKLTNLQLRTPEQIKAMTYTVDLIQYAATNLEKGIHSSNDFVAATVHEGVNIASQKLTAVKETSQKIVENTKTRVETLTKDALDSVNKAIEVLSNQLPPEQVKKFQQAKEFVSHQTETFSLQQFTELVPVALTKLNQMKSTIGEKIAANQSFSSPFINNMLHRLAVIREGLTGVLTSRSSNNLLDVTEEIQDEKHSSEASVESVEADEDSPVEAQEN